MKPIHTVGDLLDVLSIYGRSMQLHFTADGEPVRLATDVQINQVIFMDPAKSPRLDISFHSNKKETE